MRAVIREYEGVGARELFEFMEQHRDDIEQVINTVHGLVSYTLARKGDGGFSVTVCEDQDGIDESIQKAKDWVATNAPHIEASAPHVANARVIVQKH